MYAKPEKYPPDPMREISFSHGCTVSPATSSEYEICQQERMETKLPLGIIGIPIKNILRSWEELVWLQGHTEGQPNLLRPVMLPRNDLEYLPTVLCEEASPLIH